MFKLLLLTVVILLSSNSVASETYNDHTDFCAELRDIKCLTFIDNELQALPIHSVNWYKLMTFKLDYYYDKTEFKKLESLILQLLQIENQPESFKIQLYYFYSKTLMYFRRPEEAKKYANYVIQNVESLYHTFEDPLRMVEIANMEYVFGDKKKAYKLLLVAENKFGDRNDPIFHLELNTNKGHIFYQWKNYQRAERFYRRAVNWINNTGHDDKLMVAYSNLARVNQFLLKYEEALTYYQKTYALLQLQQDNNFIYVIALRIAEVKLKMKDIDEAIDYFELVEFDELSPHYHESYISLLNALNLEQ